MRSVVLATWWFESLTHLKLCKSQSENLKLESQADIPSVKVYLCGCPNYHVEWRSDHKNSCASKQLSYELPVVYWNDFVDHFPVYQT